MKYKIAVIFTTTHPDTLGNACRLQQIQFLLKEFQVSIFTNQFFFVKNRFPKSEVISLPKQNASKLPLLCNFFYSKKIARMINKSGNDCVFLYNEDATVSYWITLPSFIYVHQHGIRSNKAKNLIKRIKQAISICISDYILFKSLKQTSLNFVVSQSIIDLLRSRDVNNVHLIPHGIKIKDYQRPSITPVHDELALHKKKGHFIMTYTGWICENRGFQLMLNTLKEAVKINKHIVLAIAGAEGEFFQKIEDFSKNNSLSPNIINFGKIESSLIPGILYYSDIGLSFLDDVPAYQVSPPQKVIEYFAAGKPVICNKIQTHEMLVTNGVNGYILNPDPNEIAEAVIRLKNNGNLYETMVKNAYKTGSNNDIENSIGTMVKLMKGKLSGN